MATNDSGCPLCNARERLRDMHTAIDVQCFECGTVTAGNGLATHVGDKCKIRILREACHEAAQWINNDSRGAERALALIDEAIDRTA